MDTIIKIISKSREFLNLPKIVVSLNYSTSGTFCGYTEFSIIKKKDGYYLGTLLVGEYAYEREGSLKYLHKNFHEAMNIAIDIYQTPLTADDDPIQFTEGANLILYTPRVKKAEYYAGGKKSQDFNNIIQLKDHYNSEKPIAFEYNCYRFLPSNIYVPIGEIDSVKDLIKRWEKRG